MLATGIGLIVAAIAIASAGLKRIALGAEA